jgi:3-methyladenine DNA glycosylase AlkD
MLKQLKKEMYSLADPEKAELAKRFDKTGEGEYGEHLKYLGINVPILRKVTKKYELNLKEIQELLNINNQDFKFVALVILEKKYRKENNKKKIFNFYLQNTKNINNWELVDISAYKIVGIFFLIKIKKFFTTWLNLRICGNEELRLFLL